MFDGFLVTGAAGFIGSHFVKLLFERNPEAKVTVLDKLTYAGNPNNLKGLEKFKGYSFVKGDICDKKTVEKTFPGHEVIVNFAAESAVDRSIQEPDAFIKSDIFGTYTLLEESRKQGIKKFIQISTDEVYGEALEKPFEETDTLMPRSPYSASKTAADRLAYSYFTSYGLPVIITRSSNNYGPFAYPEKVIPLFITNILEGKKIPIYGTGKNSRDWLHVRDNCEAIKLLIEKGIDGEVYNIGAGNEKSVLELVDAISKELNASKNVINFVVDRPGHDRRYAINCAKINALGWKPKISFEKGIKETVKWYKENEAYWKPLKKDLERFARGYWSKEAKK